MKHKRVENIKLDITDDKAVKKFYKDLKHVDLLINNAGIGVYTPTLKRTKKEFLEVVNVNLLGTFLMSQNAIKKMIKQKKGMIVNIASVYGIKSSDSGITAIVDETTPEVYSITKAGTIMLTKYLAAHFASNNIQVNCISPGGIHKKQNSNFVKKYSSKTPAGRMANTKDIQSALTMLISESSNYINGSNIVVDGVYILVEKKLM